MKKIIPFILIIVSSCKVRNNNASDLYINLEDYDINKINLKHIPNLKFTSAYIDEDLDFVPYLNPTENFYKSKFNGKVKSVTEYSKSSSRNYKKFRFYTEFNEKGYKTEHRSQYGREKYFYDIHNNLIKEIEFNDSDTSSVKQIWYNPKKKVIRVKKTHHDQERKQYDIDAIIEYDDSGKPISIKNHHINASFSYVKKIAYDGNVVTISKYSLSNKKLRDDVFVYSKEYNVLKHKFGYHTVFNEYNTKKQLVKSMTYRDNEYCCTDHYKYNEKGETASWVFTNHLKNHEEIHPYTYKYDSLQNVIYNHSSDNVTNNEYETFYEYVYFKK